MSKIPIVFFGTGPVAARSLKLLVSDFDVVAVVTKPRPEHHHGEFPVIDAAEELGLTPYFVRNKKELTELVASKPFDTEVGILIDFGIIVSREVIDYFPKGIVNSHFSLLPDLRGADPITFAILSGQKKTGVSLLLIDEGMDTGPVWGCGVQELDGTETVGSLTDTLIYLSDALLKEEIPRYLSSGLKGIPQEKLNEHIPDYPTEPTYSRKIAKEDGVIDWTKPAEVLEREVRAYKDWPKSRAKLANFDVIITSSKVSSYPIDSSPGQIIIDGKRLLVGTSKDWLEIIAIQVPGKKEMSAESFLAGYASRLS